MSATIEAPVVLSQEVAHLRLSPRSDERLQKLMDLNTNGRLSASEREELELLVELSESLSLLRGQALVVLGERPQ